LAIVKMPNGQFVADIGADENWGGAESHRSYQVEASQPSQGVLTYKADGFELTVNVDTQNMQSTVSDHTFNLTNEPATCTRDVQ